MGDQDYDTMREQDKTVFENAAKIFGVWILVRAANPASLKYVGLPGFCPKPIDCKAKTADRGPNAGLVMAFDAVDPLSCYSAKKYDRAKNAWQEFLESQGVRSYKALSKKSHPRFRVDIDLKSPRFGCLMLVTGLGQGEYIHADYDLKGIMRELEEDLNVGLQQRLHGQLHIIDPYFRKVQLHLNGQIGPGMIQHAGEDLFADHTEDEIHVFPPTGMPHDKLIGKDQIALFYTGFARRTGRPNKYGVMKIDVSNPPSLEFERFAIEWFENRYRRVPG